MEYLIVPDGTMTHRFWLWPTIPINCQQIVQDQPKTLPIETFDIYYDVELQRFHPVNLEHNKTVQVVWQSDYEKIAGTEATRKR